MFKRLFVVTALMVALGGSAVGVSSVSANGNGNGGSNGNGQSNGGGQGSNTPAPVVEGICTGLDSGKIDVTGSHKTLTITAPTGKVITGYCVKAGSVQQGDGPEYIAVVPNATVVTIAHSTEKDISHYSVSYVTKPGEVELKADVKYAIVCDVLTQEAKITFTNGGTKSGQVELNGAKFDVAVDASILKSVPISVNGTKITIKIDGKTTFDEVYKCIGGQGGGSTTPTPTPVVTTPAPVAGAGESTAVTTTAVESDVMSLPYTAGNGVQVAVLIAGLAAVLTAIVAALTKKTYLKQI